MGAGQAKDYYCRFEIECDYYPFRVDPQMITANQGGKKLGVLLRDIRTDQVCQAGDIKEPSTFILRVTESYSRSSPIEFVYNADDRQTFALEVNQSIIPWPGVWKSDNGSVNVFIQHALTGAMEVVVLLADDIHAFLIPNPEPSIFAPSDFRGNPDTSLKLEMESPYKGTLRLIGDVVIQTEIHLAFEAA
jgi:hypothetical protein